ncbi:MAG: nucleotide-diphospho-sugar transferase [Monoraphidium minutum]|nr:MAG: nucleotide-diphospho-sugar transferase [Monoraphidium minutum]
MCSALVQIRRLSDLGSDPTIDRVIVIPDSYKPRPALTESAGRLGARLLHTFNMTEYKRVVFMDSDCLVLRSPDWLFGVPEADLSAPRAYWLDPGELKPDCGSATWRATDGPQVGLQMKFTSAVMVINPSERIWNRLVNKYFPNGAAKILPGYYDMDLLNVEFRNEVQLLRGESVMALTLHWSEALDPVPSAFKPYMSREELLNLTTIAHFSPTKPWMWRDIRTRKPAASPLFYGLFETWGKVSEQVC